MVENIILVLAAAIGTVGFALMLRLRLNRLPIIAVSTALCYSLYLLVFHFSVNDFFANFTAAVFAAAVSEFLARYIKAPVTVFLIPTILPLVPGANLYYTIDAFFCGELRNALNFFSLMGRAIGAILLGIITVNTVMKCIRNYKEQ
ncbi:MAG: threonine/serine exporter family protein, partial [Clostridia bacterium]|nr:threonine/serine exporter family protein [Clostridia bacterium]